MRVANHCFMEEEEERVVVVRAKMVIVMCEGWGFEEVFPFFTHTLESNNGFDGKALENVGDYLKG